MFTPLNKEEISSIVKMQLKGIEKLLEQNGVKLEITVNHTPRDRAEQQRWTLNAP